MQCLENFWPMWLVILLRLCSQMDVGYPVHSEWEFFGAVGEIVAASLAQSGPPPCFLEESTNNESVDPNVHLRSLDIERHQTPTERQPIDKIKGDLQDYHDITIDHRYTGPVKEDMMDDIICSIVVSTVSRKFLSLGQAQGRSQSLWPKIPSSRPSWVMQTPFYKGTRWSCWCQLLGWAFGARSLWHENPRENCGESGYR